ncbi:MAG TPA: type II toxin-antitoxin system VapC family toxin [Solirubrobacteraceae bacterium]|nr:type II toxin-antitoxin system VapC family toxin [Solirubrobacteraceae bacterium]
MNSSFVCDASAIAALLLDSGPDGQWVTQTIASGEIAAPALVTYETGNVIRRHELAGQISPDQSAQAHADLLDLAIELWPYDLLAMRAWELRANLSIYDATYVALAEIADRTLVTLDKRLAKAPGSRCRIAAP